MLPIFKPQHRVAGHLAVLLLASALHITIGDMSLEGFEQLDAFNPEICGKSFAQRNKDNFIRDELRASRIRKHSYGGTKEFNYTDHDDDVADDDDDDDDDGDGDGDGGGSPFGRRSPARESHYDTSKRMSDGWRAQEGEIPWYVHLETKFRSKSGKVGCGGVLIHNDLVLTVAHCIQDDTSESPKSIRIFLGVHEHDGVERIRTATKQCGFPTSKKANRRDIALVWLNSPVAYGERIQPACLDLEKPVEAKSCLLAGLGFTNSHKAQPRPLLVAAQKKCGDDDDDDEDYDDDEDDDEDEEDYDDDDDDSLLYETCWMGANGRSPGTPCVGDSGGGLFCMSDGRAYVSGLVSHGPANSCTPGENSIDFYSDTYKLRKQIRSLFRDCNWSGET